MENKNKHVRAGFSTILWAVLAIVLCAAPSLRADVDIPNDGVEYNIPGDFGPTISGSLWVYGSVNLLTGADIEWWVYTTGTSVVNIKGGTVAMWIDVAKTATVTLYGTDLALDNNGNGIRDDEDSPLGYGPQTIDGTVVGFYANGDPINLTFDCQPEATVTLAVPGGEPLLEAQLWVFPSLIDRYGPLSKILAMVRLPEGISKGDIDSGRPLILYANGYDDVKIEASCQRIIQWRRNGIVHTTIIASFDKAELIEAVPKGKVELEVVGGLNTGQDFYGTDTVRIVSWSWWLRWRR